MVRGMAESEVERALGLKVSHPGRAWVREHVVQNLPQSHDITAARQHLKKSAARGPHWHKVAEWALSTQGTTFNVADWLAQTPKDRLARNIGDDWSIFDKMPATNPYILTVATKTVAVNLDQPLLDNNSFVYYVLKGLPEVVSGNGSGFRKIDSPALEDSRLPCPLPVLMGRGLPSEASHPFLSRRLLVTAGR
ncbi:putative oxalate decarboxylase [Colletotrichum sublineola]|uniref:Putative oxalate decarboxylase n=1 Tax=Colletotrichum sublineola TaxID=1173701 RepID=A0A066WWR1_COLSU|nr:putative oxalate decarboxylase [Colletotrichum sublineola]